MANMVPIQTITAGSGGISGITFTNIPQSYTDLLLVLSLRSVANDGTLYEGIGLTFNNNYSGYSERQLYGTGSGVASAYESSYRTVGYVPAVPATSNIFSNTKIYISNYASNIHKIASSDNFMENNATSSYISMHAYLNTNTAPITSISIDASRTGSNWAQYSSATLYGIRKY